MKLKQLISSILCAALVMPVVACGQGSEDANDTVPNYDKYESTNVIDIMAYSCPEPRLDEMQRVADSGINNLILSGWKGLYGVLNRDFGYNYTSQVQMEQDFFDLGKQVGINIVPCSTPKWQGDQWRLQTHWDIPDDSEDLSARADRAEMLKNATNFSIYGWGDEPCIYELPTTSGMDTFGDRVADWNKNFSDKKFYLNLLPNYANSTQMGTSSYYDYLDNAVEKVLRRIKGKRILSVDHYPMGDEGFRISSYINCLGTMAAVKNSRKSLKLELAMCLQSSNWSSEGSVDGSGLSKNLSQEDFLEQIYVSMCFGVKTFAWFTYGTVGDDREGDRVILKYQKGPGAAGIYDEEYFNFLKESNRQIAAIDNVYLAFDWDGVNYIRSDTGVDNSGALAGLKLDVDLSSRKKLSSVSATGGDCLLGSFTDSEGHEGYMLANLTSYTESDLMHYNDISTVTFNFKNTNKAYLITNGQKSYIDIENNKLELTVKGGDGVFIVPYKA